MLDCISREKKEQASGTDDVGEVHQQNTKIISHTAQSEKDAMHLKLLQSTTLVCYFFVISPGCIFWQ